jgi:hypothetical protein
MNSWLSESEILLALLESFLKLPVELKQIINARLLLFCPLDNLRVALLEFRVRSLLPLVGRGHKFTVVC